MVSNANAIPWPPPMQSVTMPFSSAIAFHRMQQAGGEHRAGRPYRVTVRDCTTFDVDHVRIQAKVLRHRNRYCREGFIDLDALDICGFPAGAIKRLLHRRNRTQSKHARLDGANTVGDKARHRRQSLLVGPSAVGHDHRCSTRIKPRCVASRNGAVLAEGRLELCEALQRGLRPIMLVLVEFCRPLARGNFDRGDFRRRTCRQPELRKSAFASVQPSGLVLHG